MKSPAVSQRMEDEEAAEEAAFRSEANCRLPWRRRRRREGCGRLWATLVTVLLVGTHAAEAITVLSKSPPDGTIVPEGKQVRLSCRTDGRWFFCVWKSPFGDKQCAIQQDENGQPQSVCQGDPRLMLETGPNNCDLVINSVMPEDYGGWMCMVTDPVTFESDKHMIQLEVGRPATVKFDPAFGAKNELRITEGDTARIRCAAVGGYPEAALSWLPLKDMQLDITSKQAVVQPNAATHTIDVYHEAAYKAQLADNGLEITCVATQLDRDGRTVMYEASTSIKLTVDKIVLPVDDALTQKIGIISGVLLAILFLILLIVFCIFVMCRKRRRRRDEQRQNGLVGGSSRPGSSAATTSDGSPEPPIKPIWTTDPLLQQPKRHAKQYQPADVRQRHEQKQMMALADMLEPGAGAGGAKGGAGTGAGHRSASQSTRSTDGSHSSWDEEDRSVGGEVEETTLTTAPKRSPSLQETHLDDDWPPSSSSVQQHPDPYSAASTLPRLRPVSAMAQDFPPGTYHHPLAQQHLQYPPYPPYASHAHHGHHHYHDPLGGRPTSAAGFPGEAVPTLPPRRMPTPNGQLTTSVKSVFDCEQGCFVNGDFQHHHHHHHGEGHHHGGHDAGHESSSHSTPSRTSETHDV